MRAHFIRSFQALLMAVLFNITSSQEQQCIQNTDINNAFGDIPSPGSCCQADVCNLPCPQEVPDPGIGKLSSTPISPPTEPNLFRQTGFGITVIIAIVLSFIIGISTLFFVKGRAEKFFVGGRSLPLVVVSITLAAQSIDSNALLGNADFSFKFHFYDGAVIPIGLGLSLLLNAVFLAGKINKEHILTLPDLFGKRYGVTVEVLVSLATSVSFLFLLAGNLVGMGVILSYLLDMSPSAGVWTSTAVVWVYTASGGLLSVAYTDMAQGAVGWLGCLVCAFWFIRNTNPPAPPPSRGFDQYIYPDLKGEGGVCDLYQGVQCLIDETLCCFNGTGITDNGAFPVGDRRVFPNQMFSPTALSPFPNAILWNWATIFILAFGNLAALDFQARCMASRTPRTATIGCIIGGCLTFLVGIPFAYLGSITRVFYGPDSVHAEFKADSCSTILGLPTCAQWLPDPLAFLHLLTNQAPPVLGAWCLFGLVAASMSTSDGAILALATVFSNNILPPFASFFPRLLGRENLLLLARLSTLPFAVIAGVIAAYSAGVTGKLLIVAFDVVLATVVAPLFGCFYTRKPSPRAALLAFITGATVRIILEFVLPKDGSFLLPYSAAEFLNFGLAASLKVPVFLDAPADEVWNPGQEPCEQVPFKDFSGLDSLSAFVASIFVFVVVQFMEHYLGPLFRFPGDVGYEKENEAVAKGVGEAEHQDQVDVEEPVTTSEA